MERFFKIIRSILIISLVACSNNKESISNNPNQQFSLDRLSDNNLDHYEKVRVLDEAFTSIPTINNDSLKRDLLLEISYQYLKLSDSVSFLKSNKEARELATILKDSSGVAATYWDLAHFHHKHKVEDSAYFYYNRAQKLYELLGDEIYSGRLLVNLAIIQKNIKDYTGSEVTTVNAISLLKPLDDHFQLYLAYNNLGTLYSELEDFAKAIEYFETAAEYLKKSKREKKLPSIWNNIGVVYHKSERFEKAAAYFDKAQNFDPDLETTDPELFATLLDNRAYTKLKSGDTADVYNQFLKSYQIRKNQDSQSGLSINSLHIAEYYFIKEDTINAVKNALIAKELASKRQNTRDILYALELLFNNVKDDAFKYSTQYISISDSLQKRERDVRNKFARIRFETDQYISETEKLNQRVARVLFVSSGILLLLILLYVIKNQWSRNKFIQQKQKANQEIYDLILAQQKNFEEGREKEKQHLSRELHDGILGKLFGVRLNLDSLNYDEGKEIQDIRYEYIEEIQNIAEEIRLISHKLNKNSIIDVDFKVVLEELIKKQHQKIHLKIDSTIKWEEVGNDIKINLYRIIQEAINNIHKHSKATEAKVEVWNNYEKLFLKVWDDGVGFSLNNLKEGIGLKNMKTRTQNINGFFSINSNSKGTLIEVEVNLK